MLKSISRIALVLLTACALAPVAAQQARYGALAIDTNQGQLYGWAAGQSTQAAANNRAMSECSGNCQIVMTIQNACGAYAADQTQGSTAYGWGRAGDGGQARSIAQNQCASRGGRNCTVRAWGCTN